MLPILWHTEKFSTVIEEMGETHSGGFRTEVFENSRHLVARIQTPSTQRDVLLMDFKESSSCEQTWRVLERENVIWSVDPEVSGSNFEKWARRGEADFVTWPIRATELRLRIGKLLDRKERLLTSFANFLDHLGDDLTGKELRILRLFSNAADQALTRDELMQAFWQNKPVHPKTLDVQIFNLRKKLQAVDMEIRYRPLTRDWQFISKKRGGFGFSFERKARG